MKTSIRHLLGAASVTAAILLCSALLQPSRPLQQVTAVTPETAAASSHGGNDRATARGRDSLRLRLTLPYAAFGSSGGGEL